MLRWRLIAAAGMIGPILALCWLDDQFNFGHPGIWLVPLAVVTTGAAATEAVSLLRARGDQVSRWVVHFGSLFMVATASIPLVHQGEPLDGALPRLGTTLAAVAVVVAIALANEMWRFHQPGRSIVQASLALFTILYIALPIAFLVQLRMLHQDRLGLLAIISVIFVVKVSDSGAYFTGRLVGKRKLAPVLSPKKTVEGAIGGLVAGCAASWFFFKFVVRWVMSGDLGGGSWATWLLYGLAIAVAGLLGDLFESLIKRDMQRKDSSQWLPGLGGVLDVMDSVLMAAPVGFAWWASGWIAP